MFLRKINQLATFIPVLLVWEYLFLFLIRNSDWYAKNAKFIDDIDNWVVGISIIHFLIFIEEYSKLKIKYFFSLFLIIQLQLLYYYIPEDFYFFLYLLIISYPIIIQFA